MKGRFVGSSGVSAGTDEDCPPVNELNASSTERTTVGLWVGVGWGGLGRYLPSPLGGNERVQMYVSVQEHHIKTISFPSSEHRRSIMFLTDTDPHIKRIRIHKIISLGRN